MADLGRWLTGGYTVPAEPQSEDPDAEAPERPRRPAGGTAKRSD